MRNIFVVQNGLDCDGFNKGSITKFVSQEVAEQYAKDMNNCSDGLCYVCVNSDEARQYCENYGLDFDRYDSFVCDENMNII